MPPCSPPWDVAAQVNLRVYLVNQPHSPRLSRRWLGEGGTNAHGYPATP